MKEKAICNSCGKELVIFYNGMCQMCYREYVRNKKNVNYKSNYNGTSEKIKKIISLYMKKEYTIKEIAQKVGYEYSNAQKVISKYVISVGVNSE